MKLAALTLPLLSAALFSSAAFADTVNLTDGPPFTFASGSDLYVRFSIWNYAVNNRDVSPYPTSVGLQLFGAEPSTDNLKTIPTSTDRYFGGYMLQGWLENADGSVSTPFTNPDAARLGLAAGSLLLGPGVFAGTNSPIAVIEADAALTLNLSQQIFGTGIADRGSSAVIHLRNTGQNLQIGLNGNSILSAISEPSIAGAGPVTTSGITRSIAVTAVPEPASFLLLLAASSAIAAAYGFVKRLRKTERGSE